MREGRWQSTVGLGLRGRTLGIYGFGRLGSMVARVGDAFGLDLLAWGRQGSLDRAQAGVPVAASKAELFERSDVLSLQLRLNAQTTGLIGAHDLARMKLTALLVDSWPSPTAPRSTSTAAPATSREVDERGALGSLRRLRSCSRPTS